MTVYHSKVDSATAAKSVVFIANLILVRFVTVNSGGIIEIITEDFSLKSARYFSCIAYLSCVHGASRCRLSSVQQSSWLAQPPLNARGCWISSI